MRGGRIRIGVLEDQQLFRESIVVLLESSGMEVVAHGPDVEDFLVRVEQAVPDVVLVGLGLERPDGEETYNGPRLLEMLRAREPRIRPLVLSGCRDMALMERCFQAGAVGYLCKLDVGCAEVLSAVERVARGEWLVPSEFVSPARPARDEHASLVGRLTVREREVLGLVASGADNPRIAARLDITERTVKAHVSNLYRKLGVHNRVEMAMLAFQLGVARPELHVPA